MALSLKARKRWALVVLLIGMPVWIVLSVWLADLLRAQFGRPMILLEVVMFVVLGIAWILPFKKVFSGVGKGDPGEES